MFIKCKKYLDNPSLYYMKINIINHIKEDLASVEYPVQGSKIIKESENWDIADNVRSELSSLPDRIYRNENDLTSGIMSLSSDDAEIIDGIPKRRSSDYEDDIDIPKKWI
jgi:hypothetical protein